MFSNIPAALAAAAFFLPSAVNGQATLNPIQVSAQDFTDSKTGMRFVIRGIDYQPGGSSGFDPSSGVDPLSDAKNCLRDAALMQKIGVNVIRSYNLDPDINHDECVSTFASVGIYMIIDVNSPLPGGSINNADPSSSYNSAYMNRTFAILDAFRNYPNTLGFFSANELINDDNTAKDNPPYIRAVTRDLKQYMKARGGRQVPIGYSAADVDDILIDTSNYVQCNNNNDNSNSDFFGLNDYEWCGDQATFESSGYNVLVEQFSNTTIPVFFSEYGCNKVLPRTFPEVPTIYSEQMSVFSGGLVYQWTQDSNNFGLIQVNDDQSASLLSDFTALQEQYAKLNYTYLTTQNSTASSLKAPACSSSLISNPNFNADFSLPAQPSGVADLIKNGVGGNVGQIVDVTQTQVQETVTNGSSPIQGLAINKTYQASSSSSGSGSSSSPSSSHNAAAEVIVPSLQTLPLLGLSLLSVIFLGQM